MSAEDVVLAALDDPDVPPDEALPDVVDGVLPVDLAGVVVVLVGVVVLLGVVVLAGAVVVVLLGVVVVAGVVAVVVLVVVFAGVVALPDVVVPVGAVLVAPVAARVGIGVVTADTVASADAVAVESGVSASGREIVAERRTATFAVEAEEVPLLVETIAAVVVALEVPSSAEVSCDSAELNAKSA